MRDKSPRGPAAHRLRAGVRITRGGDGTDQLWADAVARLHTANIEHGLLPMLGAPFLAHLYRTLASGPRMGVWLATDRGGVVGFIAGCADVRAAYWYIARKSGPRLAALACRAFLSAAVLRRLPAIPAYLLTPSESVAPAQPRTSAESRAELLAIAVDPAAQHQGIGMALVATLEQAFGEWGHIKTYHVTTNLDDPRSNRFYRGLGFEPTHTLRHHVLTLQAYRKRLEMVRPSRTSAAEASSSV